MSENKDYIKFVPTIDGKPEDDLYIKFGFNVQINDILIMYHTCLLYKNCLTLIDKGEMSEDRIEEIMTFNFILKSVQEALENRIKCLSSSYIDDAYQWCLARPAIFDICLDYYKKIKNEIKEIYNTFAYDNSNKIDKSEKDCNQPTENINCRTE